MQSVLRPKRPMPQRSDDVGLSHKRHHRVQKQDTWRRKFATVVFSAIGLWLIGSVAWWHIAWWQQSTEQTAESDSSPAHRLTQEEPVLRR